MLKIQESSTSNTRENDENANRNIINMEKSHGKEIEKPVLSHGVALGGGGGGGVPAAALSLQKSSSMYPLTSLLTVPLLTNYNALDPLGDPILWTSFLPPGSSHTSEVLIHFIFISLQKRFFSLQLVILLTLFLL